MEQKSKGSSEFNTWYSPVLLIKWIVSDRWSVTGRGEYYSDENGVIISTGTENGFQTSGVSLNLDYRISDKALWRVEGRTLTSKDEIFTANDELIRSNTFLTSSLAVTF